MNQYVTRSMLTMEEALRISRLSSQDIRHITRNGKELRDFAVVIHDFHLICDYCDMTSKGKRTPFKTVDKLKIRDARIIENVQV